LGSITLSSVNKKYVTFTDDNKYWLFYTVAKTQYSALQKLCHTFMFACDLCDDDFRSVLIYLLYHPSN